MREPKTKRNETKQQRRHIRHTPSCKANAVNSSRHDQLLKLTLIRREEAVRILLLLHDLVMFFGTHLTAKEILM